MSVAAGKRQPTMNREKETPGVFGRRLREAARARRTVLRFTTYTFPKYQINWHHALISKYLNDLVFGKIHRLIIETPPRHGKSELVSRRLPAFAFGHNPNEQIILASYSDSLAKTMSRATQRIMSERSYRHLFPETRIPLPGDTKIDGIPYLRNANEFEIMDSTGTYKCAGVGTGITGRGFTLGIIDDPFKDRKDADSQNQRDAVWDWFSSTFMTRGEGENFRVLITMTRWHYDDLVGRILKKQKEKWHLVRLPALYSDQVEDRHPKDLRETGQALWPWKYSENALKEIQEISVPRDWYSLYQQMPMIEGGNIFHRDWWKYYRMPPGKFDEIIQSWDMAFKDMDHNDYVVGQVWGRKGAEKFLLDQVRDRMSFTATIQAVQNLSVKWPMSFRKLVEDKANGPAVIDMLKKKISGLIPVEPDGSKEARAQAVSATVQAGNVYLPEGRPWINDYVEELVRFPSGEHDDQVDATTQALRYFEQSNIERLEQLLKD